MSASRARASAGHRQTHPNGSRSSGLALALVLAVIPVAVGLGVLVGRASTGGDAKLIAALKAQTPQVITAGGGASGVSAATGAAPAAVLTSNFPLQQGYSIELRTVKAQGADQASVSRAEAVVRAKGAKQVGLITQRDFHVTPRPPAGAYVIYSGAFRSKADAERALAKLKKAFPAAIIIEVQSVATHAAAGKVLTRTSYGTANQITGLHVSKAQLNAGKQVVTHIQKTEGNSYVNAQKGLPSQISIP